MSGERQRPVLAADDDAPEPLPAASAATSAVTNAEADGAAAEPDAAEAAALHGVQVLADELRVSGAPRNRV